MSFASKRVSASTIPICAMQQRPSYPTPQLPFLAGLPVGAGLFVLTAIFRDLLLALMKPLLYRRSPWYQHSLICKALPKVSMILLHDVENRFLGELSMVVGK
jgi:hypothetical protein